MKKMLIVLFCFLTLNHVSTAQAQLSPATLQKIRQEADYILSCQYMTAGNAYGAINNVQGAPTWVVPRENAMAILGLILASEALSDSTYLNKAQLAADYLVRVQEQVDGGWYDQYSYANIYTYSKSPTQTAEVMIAFYKLGYDGARYNSMKNGATFLIECQKASNKTGNDDGLICGGKDASGNYYTWRWASDNSYAYQALIAAQAWASTRQDNTFAAQCAQAAQNILTGINNYLYNMPAWHAVINKDGVPLGNPDLPPQYNNLPTWISYAPQMLDLPAQGVGSLAVGEWIRSSFQQADGSCIGYVAENNILKTRKYPGLSFQASLCWLDLKQNTYANNALNWAQNSGLHNIVNGGWVDWIEISPNPGSVAPSWQRFIDTSFYNIACLTGGYNFNTSETLNLNLPWYQNTTPYNSTGAAVAQMISNYIREGASQPLLTQNEIYNYAKFPNPLVGDLNPDELDKTLGYYDPYNYLVSNWADSYDSLADGNPYQGYNFTVDTYNPATNPNAMNDYVRDICHWMAYTVTKEDWWRDGELVARPNTPAAVPIYGTYNRWVAIKGYAASLNPCPEPHINPFNTPNFTVYGFWVKDPLITGIGKDTYKTAAECQQTYFLSLNTTDSYRGLLLQVAEPPPEISTAAVKISRPKYDLANLEFAGVKSASAKTSFANAPSARIIITKKQTWRDIVDTNLLADKEAVAAFNNIQKGAPLFVKRPDKANSDYYLLPFGAYDRNKDFFARAVIILDAKSGAFKEASWVKQAEKFLKVGKKDAIYLIKKYIINNFLEERKKLPKSPQKLYFLKLQQLYYKYSGLINSVNPNTAIFQLHWQPTGASPSPYKPYWKINTNGHIWYVTQEGKVTPALNRK